MTKKLLRKNSKKIILTCCAIVNLHGMNNFFYNKIDQEEKINKKLTELHANAIHQASYTKSYIELNAYIDSDLNWSVPCPRNYNFYKSNSENEDNITLITYYDEKSKKFHNKIRFQSFAAMQSKKISILFPTFATFAGNLDQNHAVIKFPYDKLLEYRIKTQFYLTDTSLWKI